MKVLHVTNLYPYASHPTYGIFVKEQIDSLVLQNLQDYYFLNAREEGFLVYIKSIFKLKNLLKNYDIIHCHHQFSALAVILCGSNKKIVLSVLGDISKRSLFNRLIYSIVKPFCSVIIFKNKVPKLTPKFFLLPNGVNLDFFRPFDKYKSKRILKLDLDKRYVLFVSNGSLENPIKRHDKFLELYNYIRLKYKPEFDLVPLYLCKVNRELVPYYYNSADFMILTSDHEGSPNAVKEAMACNLPIISTPVGDVPFLLTDVKNSFVSSTGDVSDLVLLFDKLAFGEKSNGRERLESISLSTRCVSRKLIEIYNKLYYSLD